MKMDEMELRKKKKRFMLLLKVKNLKFGII